MTEPVYRLHHNTDHIDYVYDVNVDAELRKFPDLPEGPRYHNQAPGGSLFRCTGPLDFPERIEFVADPSILDTIDYPYTDVDWPIMSKRMLDILLSVGDFPHRVYPVIMCAGKIVSSKELNKDVTLWTENDNYVAVQLIEYLDIFDHERSIFQYSYEDRKDIVELVDKLILKEPKGGFPPLFRMATSPIRLRFYVSSLAKAALEAANITGVEFWDSENYF